jgi:uncharacterized protein with ATP-grasp and redox domains
VINTYKKVKKKSNDLVLKMYPELREIIERSEDSMKTANRLSRYHGAFDG